MPEKKNKEITKEDVMAYLKSNPLTEDEVLKLYAETFPNVLDEVIDKPSEEKMFAALSAVDGFAEYLRTLMAIDIKSYFSAASPMEQLIIKGSYGRTMAMKGKLVKKAVQPARLKNKRYAR